MYRVPAVAGSSALVTPRPARPARPGQLLPKGARCRRVLLLLQACCGAYKTLLKRKGVSVTTEALVRNSSAA